MTYQKERFNPTTAPSGAVGISGWATRLFQTIARAMPWAPHVDARDFITASEGADVSAQLQVAASAVGTGTLFLAARAYRLANDVTILAATLLTGAPGAVLRPSTGHVLTVAGVVDPSVRTQLFSNADGGTVAFTAQVQFRPEWFGVVGDGSTSDSAAIAFMLASVPSYCDIVLSSKLQMLLTDEMIAEAFSGLTIRSEIPNLPDGQGPQLLWGGPSRLISGVDANTTSGSKTLTTTTGLFTADMVGQRIVVAFAGSQNGGLMAKIASYTSTTSVELDTAASSNQSNRDYTVGPAVLYLKSCGKPVIRGLSIRLASTGCQMGYSGYIASGTKTLNVKAFGQFTSGDLGKQIRVTGAGPSGSDLYTTITAVSGSAGGAQTVTLNDAASTTIATTALTTYLVGRSSTSFPARYGILSDESGVHDANGNAVTGTGGIIRDNHITTPNPIDYDWYGIAFAITTLQNQEYHHVEHNAVLGGGTLEVDGDGVTSGVATTLGSPQLTGSNSYFAPAHMGRRVRIPNAGGSGVALDSKIIAVWTDATRTVLQTSGSPTKYADAAVTAGAAVSNERLFLGEGKSYGVVVGNSSNAKGIELRRRNLLNSHRWGLWIQNGSAHSSKTSWTGCEADIRVDASSEPMYFDADDSEQSLRHVDLQSHDDNITLESPRLGNFQMMPNGAYLHQDQNSGLLLIRAPKFDNKVYSGSTMHKLTSSNNRLHLVRPKYLSGANPTLADLGISQSQIDTATAWVFVEGHHIISDAPADIFTIGSAGGGTTASGAHGSWYFGGIAQLAKGHSLGVPRVLSSTVTLDLKDGVVLASASGGNITVTLPSPSLSPCVRVMKTDASAHTVTLQDGASGTINGAASLALATQYATATLCADGTNWYAF